MLELIREFVYQYTGSMTDGQFFGSAFLFVLIALGGLLLTIEAVRNWRVDARLQRKLKKMPHGGLGRQR